MQASEHTPVFHIMTIQHGQQVCKFSAVARIGVNASGISFCVIQVFLQIVIIGVTLQYRVIDLCPGNRDSCINIPICFPQFFKIISGYIPNSSLCFRL